MQIPAKVTAFFLTVSHNQHAILMLVTYVPISSLWLPHLLKL